MRESQLIIRKQWVRFSSVIHAKLLLEEFVTDHYKVMFSVKLLCGQVFQPETIRKQKTITLDYKNNFRLKDKQ